MTDPARMDPGHNASYWSRSVHGYALNGLLGMVASQIESDPNVRDPQHVIVRRVPLPLMYLQLAIQTSHVDVWREYQRPQLHEKPDESQTEQDCRKPYGYVVLYQCDYGREERRGSFHVTQGFAPRSSLLARAYWLGCAFASHEYVHNAQEESIHGPCCYRREQHCDTRNRCTYRISFSCERCRESCGFL